MPKQEDQTPPPAPVITLDATKILGGIQAGAALVAAGTKQLGLKPATA